MKKMLLIFSLGISTAAYAMTQNSPGVTTTPATGNLWLLGIKLNAQTVKEQVVTDVQQAYALESAKFYAYQGTFYVRLADSRPDIIRKLQRYEWFGAHNLYPDVEVSAKLPAQNRQEKPEIQVSPLLKIGIEYKNTLEANEIQKDVKAAFAKRMGGVRDNELSNKLWIYIDASENEIREKLKNKQWASQIKEIIADRAFSAN